MLTVLLVLHLLTAIFLVSLILMQRSEGGALSGLGGGSGQTDGEDSGDRYVRSASRRIDRFGARTDRFGG